LVNERDTLYSLAWRGTVESELLALIRQNGSSPILEQYLQGACLMVY